MTTYEFLQDYLGYLKGDNIDPITLNILASLVDLNKDQSKLNIKKKSKQIFTLKIRNHNN